MTFAEKIRFSDDEESKQVLSEFKEEFKNRTGFDYPKSDLAWREILAKAGFSPQEAREIRTKQREESEIAEYYHGLGALLTEIYARLEKRQEETVNGPSGPKSEKPTPPNIEFRKDSAEISFDGKVYAGVDTEAAETLFALVKSFPERIGLTNSLRTKPKRQIEKLPAELQAIIDTNNKGSMLKI